MLKYCGSDLDFRGCKLYCRGRGGEIRYRDLRLRKIPAAEGIRHGALKPMPSPAEAISARGVVVEEICKKKLADHGSP